MAVECSVRLNRSGSEFKIVLIATSEGDVRRIVRLQYPGYTICAVTTLRCL